MKNILVLMAEGFEEIEAITPIDLLRRAGHKVDMASIDDEQYVTGSHGIVIQADVRLSYVEMEKYDAVILPGGPGHKNLLSSDLVKEVVLEAADSGKLVAAICASPTVLGAFGLLEGKNASCYPGMESGLTGAKPNTNVTNTDGNIITSRGAGTAVEFGLAIVEYFDGKEVADELGKKVVWNF